MSEFLIIHCETCRAKLRVRDQRALGQILACPKCGSMVQVAAPAIAAAVVKPTNAVKVAPTSTAAAVPAAAASSPGGNPAPAAIGWAHRPIVLWSAIGTALVAAGGLIGAATFHSSEEVVATAEKVPPSNAVTSAGAESVAPATNAEEAPLPASPTEKAVSESPASENVATTETVPANAAVIREEHNIAKEPVAVESNDQPLSPPQQETRTLKLEPVGTDANAPRTEAKTQVAVARSKAPSDVAAQLAFRYEAIDVPAMPLAKFVDMLSQTSAVPIKLDSATLAAAGVTPLTKVTVHEKDITVEALLTIVLEAHGLAWEERGGELVVVRTAADSR